MPVIPISTERRSPSGIDKRHRAQLLSAMLNRAEDSNLSLSETRELLAAFGSIKDGAKRKKLLALIAYFAKAEKAVGQQRPQRRANVSH